MIYQPFHSVTLEGRAVAAFLLLCHVFCNSRLGKIHVIDLMEHWHINTPIKSRKFGLLSPSISLFFSTFCPVQTALGTLQSSRLVHSLFTILCDHSFWMPYWWIVITKMKQYFLYYSWYFSAHALIKHSKTRIYIFKYLSPSLFQKYSLWCLCKIKL